MILIHEPEIRNIYMRIRKMENRRVADSMARMGLHYEQNHGVIIADLIQLASQYPGRNDLAEKMRKIPIRELRLMAEMIDDHSLLSDSELNKIVQEINNSELSEQFAVHLTKHIEQPVKKSLKWANHTSLYPAAAGFNSLSFFTARMNDSQIEQFFNIIISHPLRSESQLQKYMARCLRKLAAAGSSQKEKVLRFIEKLKTASKDTALMIEESEPFIKYLN